MVNTVDPMPSTIGAGLHRIGWDEIADAQAFLSSGLGSAIRYFIHPGDLAWWARHHDRRRPQLELWLGEPGLVVIDGSNGEISAFARPTDDLIRLIEWAQVRLMAKGTVGWVADTDEELTSYLDSHRYSVSTSNRSYRWELGAQRIPAPDPPQGWELRPMRGEEEADNRRQASHAAFESTMDSAMHLERYLGFMRSPVYDRERDLVAVAPDGRIASFMVWWPDRAGIAQIEPFGTHPDFQRKGVGRALLHFGLARMAGAGMSVCRVVTDDYRVATAFYPAAGFADVGGLSWWSHA